MSKPGRILPVRSVARGASERTPKPPANKPRPGQFGWIWLATVLLFIVSAIVAPGATSPSSLAVMLPFAGILAIVATGQTLVIQQRGLDLSASGTMTLAGVVVAKVALLTGSVTASVAAGVAAGALAGLVNGFCVARIHITPIVATLAVNALLIGAVRSLSGGMSVAMPDSLKMFSHQSLLGLPCSLIVSLVFVAVIAVLIGRTVLGRRFIAVGANPAAANAAGIVVLRYRIGTYAIAGVSFAVAGVLYAGFIGNASNTAGNEFLLPGIAAVVIGGTPFSGGRGSVVASAVAALFVTQLGQMVLALGANNSTQLLVQALAIVVASSIRHVSWAGGLRRRGVESAREAA